MNFVFKAVGRYIYKRSLEASTWRNIILFIGGTWSVKNPEQAEMIIPVCVSIAGLIGSFLPDIFSKKDRVENNENVNDTDFNSNDNVLSDSSVEMRPKRKRKLPEDYGTEIDESGWNNK